MSATAVLNLSKAGFTDAQVTALAAYFDAQMATKGDIAEIKLEIADVKLEIERVRSDLSVEIERVRSDLSVEIERVRSNLSVEIAKVRSDLEVKIGGLDVKIADIKADTIKWVAGLLIAQGAAVVALIRFLLHP